MIFSTCFCDEKLSNIFVVANSLKEAWDKLQASKFVKERKNFFYIDKFLSNEDYEDFHKGSNPKLFRGIFKTSKDEERDIFAFADSAQQAMDCFCESNKGNFSRFEDSSNKEDIIIV